MPERFDADGPRGADSQRDERPLIEGRFRSYEDKAQWMLRGRERPEPRHPDALPDAEHAVIDPRKFTAYSMDPTNLRNQGKWKAWIDLGWDIHDDAVRTTLGQEITEMVRDELPRRPAAAEGSTGWGERYKTDFEVTGPNGRKATLQTRW